MAHNGLFPHYMLTLTKNFFVLSTNFLLLSDASFIVVPWLGQWVPRACALSSLDLGSRLESIVAAFSREKSLAQSESC